ncbi:hypothetical protein BH10BAC4_BH10BAC4_21800 [soil metagenome]
MQLSENLYYGATTVVPLIRISAICIIEIAGIVRPDLQSIQAILVRLFF